MKKFHIEREEVVRVIKTLKNGNVPGEDGLKAEIFKGMLNSPKLIETMKHCFNEIVNTGKIPISWKTSITKMIPKKTKPTASDLRPIAITNVVYKIFMAIIRDKIEDHLKRNHLTKENQNGFTRGARIEDNIFILNYCIEKSKTMKLPLIILAIDYSKAFDSVDRKQMIKIMKEYRIDEKIIDVIAEIYTGDSTKICLRKDMEENMEITSGIRQGCTCSSVMFKMVTFAIMRKLEQTSDGFSDKHFKINSLYFADDALIMEHSIEKMKMTQKTVAETSAIFGLNLNKKKSAK